MHSVRGRGDLIAPNLHLKSNPEHETSTVRATRPNGETGQVILDAFTREFVEQHVRVTHEALLQESPLAPGA